MSIEARGTMVDSRFVILLPPPAGRHPQFQLKKENTEFRLSTDATDWLLALPNYRSSYESEYVKLPTSALSNQGGVLQPVPHRLPLLIHEPGCGMDGMCEAD